MIILKRIDIGNLEGTPARDIEGSESTPDTRRSNRYDPPKRYNHTILTIHILLKIDIICSN